MTKHVQTCMLFGISSLMSNQSKTKFKTLQKNAHVTNTPSSHIYNQLFLFHIY